MKRFLLVLFMIGMVSVIGGCGEHEHIAKEVVCEKPVLCRMCGEVMQESAPHVYAEGTQGCGVKRNCTRCGEIDKESLGHSTNVGICEKCGQAVNKEWAIKLRDAVLHGSTANDEAIHQFELYPDDANQAIAESLVYFEVAKQSFMKAKMLCGNYQEVSTLKAKLEALVQKTPTQYDAEDPEKVMKFFEDIEAAIFLVNELEEEMNKLTESYGSL